MISKYISREKTHDAIHAIWLYYVIFGLQIENGAWTSWGKWSKCSITCGYVNGTITRSRNCNSPAPIYGGDDCPGNSTEADSCEVNGGCKGKSTQ